MSTPVATIADALIAFILSLLRDPAAVEEFAASPKAMIASNGLQDACAADVQAVKPVIVDHPHVMAKPPGPPPPAPDSPDEVIKEITRIVNQFTTIDARSTIVDQSTNQNIWTNGGDVTQIFDQEAVVASGDEAIAAGDDATLVDSDVDVTIGDVSIGNTENDGSFNTVTDGGDEAAPTADVAADPALAPAEGEADPSAAAAAAGAAVEGAVDAAIDTAETTVETVVEEVSAPAEDPLAADLTATDTYASDDTSSIVVDEPYIEEPAEDQ